MVAPKMMTVAFLNAAKRVNNAASQDIPVLADEEEEEVEELSAVGSSAGGGGGIGGGPFLWVRWRTRKAITVS